MFSNEDWATHTQQIIDEAPPSPTWATDEPFQFIERYKPGHIDLISARAVYIHEYGEPDEPMGLHKSNLLEELLHGLTYSCDTCRETLSEVNKSPAKAANRFGVTTVLIFMREQRNIAKTLFVSRLR